MARKKKENKKFVKNQENPSFSPRFNSNLFFILKRKVEKIPLRVLLALTIFLGLTIPLQLEKEKKQESVLGLQAQAQEAQKKAFEWEKILRNRPDFRDGWLQLAAIYYKIGDKQKAREAIVQAKALDPNNESILSLEKFLETN